MSGGLCTGCIEELGGWRGESGGTLAEGMPPVTSPRFRSCEGRLIQEEQRHSPR